jgi:hypothetical protein
LVIEIITKILMTILTVLHTEVCELLLLTMKKRGREQNTNLYIDITTVISTDLSIIFQPTIPQSFLKIYYNIIHPIFANMH